jgi:hypothetical protein
MEQAAYDVLFNKADWRTRTAKRRDIWKPVAGTTGPDSPDYFITRGLGAKLGATILDPFRAYPLCLWHVPMKLPLNCWAPNISELRSSGVLSVKPGPTDVEDSVDDNARSETDEI